MRGFLLAGTALVLAAATAGLVSVTGGHWSSAPPQTVAGDALKASFPALAAAQAAGATASITVPELWVSPFSACTSDLLVRVAGTAATAGAPRSSSSSSSFSVRSGSLTAVIHNPLVALKREVSGDASSLDGVSAVAASTETGCVALSKPVLLQLLDKAGFSGAAADSLVTLVVAVRVTFVLAVFVACLALALAAFELGLAALPSRCAASFDPPLLFKRVLAWGAVAASAGAALGGLLAAVFWGAVHTQALSRLPLYGPLLAYGRGFVGTVLEGVAAAAAAGCLLVDTLQQAHGWAAESAAVAAEAGADSRTSTGARSSSGGKARPAAPQPAAAGQHVGVSLPSPGAPDPVNEARSSSP